MRFCWGVEACDEITVPAAVFTILVSIAFKLLSTMGAYKGVIGLLLNLLPVAVPPCHTALVGAEVFYFPTDWLHHDLTAVLASFAAIDFRMVTNMGADRAGRDAHGQRDFSAGFSLLKHLVNCFDILFFHR